MPFETEGREVTGEVQGTIFTPKGGEARVGVLLLGGSSGTDPRSAAEAIARSGFSAFSLAYFGRPGLPAALREVPLEYFRAGLDRLSASLSDPQAPMVVLGVSRGSEAALLSGVHFPDRVSAVIAVVPGNVVLCGWPPGPPAWTLGGRPLPFVTRFGPSSAVPEAEIPVERIPGPILLISAGADRVWPSLAMSRAMAERLRSRGHPGGHELLEYPAATHALGRLVPEEAGRGFLAGRLAKDPDVAARRDAWPKLLAFIERAGRAGTREAAAPPPSDD